MRHMHQCRWLAGFVLLAACSSESGPVETDTADELARPFNLQDEELAYDAKVNGVLSEAEMRGALATLAANGIAREQVEFQGRMAFVEGDMMVDIDELLAPKTADGSIEKGYTSNLVSVLESGFQGCAPYQCGAFAPTQYSRIQSGQYQFLRPDTEHMYYLVLFANPDVSAQRMATLNTQLAQAGGKIINASSSDCLNITMTVITEANYNALPNPFGTQHHIITVRPYTTNGSFAHKCSGGATIACANLPGDRGIRNDSKVLSPGKHRFGDRVHVNVDNLESVEASWIADGRPATGGAVAVLAHELMHTLGYRHTGAEFSTDIRIPGTSTLSNPNTQAGSTVPTNRRGSIMRGSPSSMDRWDCLSGESGLQCLPLEDEQILTKLYNGSCAFSTSFRNIN
jgi:hypothetical protein